MMKGIFAFDGTERETKKMDANRCLRNQMENKETTYGI